ncbi:MAG: hypothetical protein ABIH74_02515, partial [Candidatus Omnitrophota bacterium]
KAAFLGIAGRVAGASKPPKSAKPPKPMPAGSPYVMYELLRGRGVPVTAQEIAEETGLSAEYTVIRDLRTLVYLGLAEKIIDKDGTVKYKAIEIEPSTWNRVIPILRDLGPQPSSSEKQTAKKQLEGLKIGIKPVQETGITKDNILERIKQGRVPWGDVTTEACRYLVELLAEALGKKPGELKSWNFMQRLSIFGGKSLRGLVDHIITKKSFSDKGSWTRAVKALKEDLGIEDLLPPPKTLFKFTREDWETTQEILKKYPGSEKLPTDMKKFVAQRLANADITRLVLDARNGNSASFQALYSAFRNVALDIIGKRQRYVEDEMLSDLLLDVLISAMLNFKDDREGAAEFVTYFYAGFKRALWKGVERSGKERARILRFSSGPKEEKTVHGKVSMDKVSFELYDAAVSDENRTDSRIDLKAKADALRGILSQSRERERNIGIFLQYYYGSEHATFEEIGNGHNLTFQRVEQICAGIRKKVMNSEDPELKEAFPGVAGNGKNASKPAELAKPMPPGSPYAMYELLCGKIAPVTLQEIAVETGLSLESTVKRDLRTLVQLALAEKISTNGTVTYKAVFFGTSETGEIMPILRDLGAQPTFVEKQVARKQLDGLKIGIEPIPLITKDNILERIEQGPVPWGDVTTEPRLYLVELLAEALRKKPGELNSGDFQQQLPVFGGKSLQPFLQCIMKEKGFSGKGSLTKAVKALKEDLGTKDLLPPPKEKFKFTREDWAATRRILKKYPGSEKLPAGLKEFVLQRPENTDITRLVLDARSGNSASFQVLYILCRNVALSIIGKWGQNVEDEMFHDSLFKALVSAMGNFKTHGEDTAGFVTYFHAGFERALQRAREIAGREKARVSQFSDDSEDKDTQRGEVSMNKMSFKLYDPAASLESRIVSRIDFEAKTDALREILPLRKKTERNIRIFMLYYYGGERVSFGEIGREYNLTRQNMRQICGRIIRRIKDCASERIKENFPEIFAGKLNIPEPPKPAELAKPMPAGSPYAMYELLLGKPAPVTEQEVAVETGLSVNAVVKSDLRTLFQLGLAEKTIGEDGEAQYKVVFFGTSETEKVMPILKNLGAQPTFAEKQTARKQLEGLKIGIEPIPLITKDNILERIEQGPVPWGDVTTEPRLYLVELLAEALRKKPGELKPGDFKKELPIFNYKPLKALLDFYARENNITGKGYSMAALEVLMKDLDITKILSYREQFKFTREDWATTREILKKYPGSENLPRGLEKFLKQPLDGNTQAGLVQDAKSGNKASFQVLYVLCRKMAGSIVRKIGKHIDEGIFYDQLFEVLIRKMFDFEEEKSNNTKFTNYFYARFRGALWDAMTESRRNNAGVVRLSDSFPGQEWNQGEVRVEKASMGLYERALKENVIDLDAKTDALREILSSIKDRERNIRIFLQRYYDKKRTSLSDISAEFKVTETRVSQICGAIKEQLRNYSNNPRIREAFPGIDGRGIGLDEPSQPLKPPKPMPAGSPYVMYAMLCGKGAPVTAQEIAAETSLSLEFTVKRDLGTLSYLGLAEKITGKDGTVSYEAVKFSPSAGVKIMPILMELGIRSTAAKKRVAKQQLENMHVFMRRSATPAEDKERKWLLQMGTWFGTNEEWQEKLETADGREGVYIGTGNGGQNLSRICRGNFEFAVVVDLNPFLTEGFIPIRDVLISASGSRAEYLAFLAGVRFEKDELSSLENASLEEIESALRDKCEKTDNTTREKTMFATWETIRHDPRMRSAQKAEEVWDQYSSRHFGEMWMIHVMEKGDSWLGGREHFLKIKKMLAEDRIIAVTSDWMDRRLPGRISEEMDRRGMKHLQVSLVYISNILEWVEKIEDENERARKKTAFFENIENLPLSRDNIILFDRHGHVSLAREVERPANALFLARMMNRMVKGERFTGYMAQRLRRLQKDPVFEYNASIALLHVLLQDAENLTDEQIKVRLSEIRTLLARIVELRARGKTGGEGTYALERFYDPTFKFNDRTKNSEENLPVYADLLSSYAGMADGYVKEAEADDDGVKLHKLQVARAILRTGPISVLPLKNGILARAYLMNRIEEIDRQIAEIRSLFSGREKSAEVEVVEDLNRTNTELMGSVRQFLMDQGMRRGKAAKTADDLVSIDTQFGHPAVNGETYNGQFDFIAGDLIKVIKDKLEKADRTFTLFTAGVGCVPLELEHVLEIFYNALTDLGEDPAAWVVRVYAMDATDKYIPVTK